MHLSNVYTVKAFTYAAYYTSLYSSFYILLHLLRLKIMFFFPIYSYILEDVPSKHLDLHIMNTALPART